MNLTIPIFLVHECCWWQQAAERVLPAIFALLEAAVEVLAADAERAASASIDEPAPQLPARCAHFCLSFPEA